MKKEDIIRLMIRDIEKLDDELFVYAHSQSRWVEVSVSKFDFYMHNVEFKKTCEKWRKILKKVGVNIVFVCGWIPEERVLIQLAEDNNLILNI